MSINTTKMAKLAINKSLLKEYNGSTNERIVYMEDGDEFQIQFFNPESCVIAVSISLNGQKLSNLLVLRPGERVWLERFIDSEQKFQFSTYEVGASQEVKKAIAKNGVVELKFYKEKPKGVNYRTPIYINYSPSYDTTPYNVYNVNLSGDESNCSVASTITTGDSLRGCATMDSCFYSSASTSTSYNGYEPSPIKTSSNGSLETGRIEKGNHSNQEIDYVSGYDFNYYPFAEELIHIYPKSTKPVYKSDLTKRYCPHCGRKVSPKYNFCPGCGKKIN